MKKTLIVDSYAWVEYFKGSSEGNIVNNALEEYETVYTPVNVLAEVCEFFKKQNKDFEYAREVIESNSEIYKFSDDEWLESIDKKIEMRKSGIKNFGIMDAMVMVCAENTNGKIITGDPHFKSIEGVIFLKSD